MPVDQEKVLHPLNDDKGYVRVVESMGDDLSVVNSARVSFEKRSDTLEERDARLIDYLISHRHTSTLRHCFMTFEVRAPLLVARQWWRHAIGSNYGEYSVGWNEACLPADQLIRGATRDYTVGSLMNKMFVEYRKAREEGRDPEPFYLLSVDEDGDPVRNRVKDIISQEKQKLVAGVMMEDDSFFHATGDHKVLTPDGYMEVHEFTPETRVMNVTENGIEPVKVKMVRWRSNEPEYVYDIEMENEPHNFIAGRTVVHNSRRYVTEEEEFHLPTKSEWRWKPDSSIKQGSGDMMPDDKGEFWSLRLQKHQEKGLELYRSAMEDGVAPEQARYFLSAYGLYVSFYWTASLNAILHFLELRTDSHAQWEMQQYADAIEEFTAEQFPVSLEKFQKAIAEAK